MSCYINSAWFNDSRLSFRLKSRQPCNRELILICNQNNIKQSFVILSEAKDLGYIYHTAEIPHSVRNEQINITLMASRYKLMMITIALLILKKRRLHDTL